MLVSCFLHCRQYLDQEVALSEDMVHKYSDLALAKFNKGVGELRRLFLVEDLVDSIKVGGATCSGVCVGALWCELIGWLSLISPLQFAVLMWILTYVGALFNGLTLLILGETSTTC